MEQRTLATQCGRLVLAGIVTLIVMGASWFQIAASSREMVRAPISTALTLASVK